MVDVDGNSLLANSQAQVGWLGLIGWLPSGAWFAFIKHFISRVRQLLWIRAIWLHRHLLHGVDSVRLQILLIGMCRQCGSWSVAGHNHRKVTGWDPICAGLHDMGLDLSGNSSTETMCGWPLHWSPGLLKYAWSISSLMACKPARQSNLAFVFFCVTASFGLLMVASLSCECLLLLSLSLISLVPCWMIDWQECLWSNVFLCRVWWLTLSQSVKSAPSLQ